MLPLILDKLRAHFCQFFPLAGERNISTFCCINDPENLFSQK